MNWLHQEETHNKRNPIEGTLGQLITIIIGVVSLAIAQAHPPGWLNITLYAILTVAAIAILWSPFSTAYSWTRNRLLRRRSWLKFRNRLTQQTDEINKLLDSTYTTSFHKVLETISSVGKPSPHAQMKESNELSLIGEWYHFLRTYIKYSTPESFDSIMAGFDVLIRDIVAVTRNARIRAHLVLDNPEVTQQGNNSIRKNWEEFRNHGNAFIHDWKAFRKEYELSMGRNTDMYYESIEPI